MPGFSVPLTPDQQAARKVADEIALYVVVYRVTTTMVGVLFEAPNFDEILRVMNLKLVRGTLLDHRRKDGSNYDPATDFRDEVYRVRENRDLQIQMPVAAMMSIVSLAGDAVQKAGLYKRFPSCEMEFLRHVRNAVSHGNKFKFANHEPKTTASFKQFTLDYSLNGRYLWDYIWPADVMELLDHIEQHLREA